MVKTLRTQTARMVSKPHRTQVYVSDIARLQMLILITEFGLSVKQAVKILEVPYPNARFIYKVFQMEKRVISNTNII